MMTSWRVSLTAGAAALALLAGIAAAKSHGHGRPENPGGGHGHGSHGNPHGGGSGHGGPHGGGGSCDGASSLIGAFVDETCPCAGTDDGAGGTIAWKNHGQYVRCVAHAVRDAARSLGVKRRCARGLVPCAAHSSCGKSDAAACIAPVAGTCAGGLCTDDPSLTCATDADCPLRECSEQSAEDCAAIGGTSTTGSCCFASPSGAFLD